MVRDPESDASGDPADIQLERARGAFEIHVESSIESEKDFHRLRRALRLSRADIPWLRAHVPGVVRRGASVDLIPVLERIREAGHTAQIRRRGDTGADS